MFINVCNVYWVPEKNFLATFGSHLEFLCKMQKCSEIEAIFNAIFDPQCLLSAFHKNYFPTTFGGHLEFWH